MSVFTRASFPASKFLAQIFVKYLTNTGINGSAGIIDSVAPSYCIHFVFEETIGANRETSKRLRKQLTHPLAPYYNVTYFY